VTSVTLSTEQATLARKRVADAGLSSLVDIRVEDYRDVAGRYDAVLSVEMIEAVGSAGGPLISRHSKPALRQWPNWTPGNPDGRRSTSSNQDIMDMDPQIHLSRWTHSLRRVHCRGRARSHDLRIEDRMLFGPSYARTLQLWRDAFTWQPERVATLGFDETFRRMWEFYLAYSEAGFRSGYLDVGQFVLSRTA